jgi:hypothetical protein
MATVTRRTGRDSGSKAKAPSSREGGRALAQRVRAAAVLLCEVLQFCREFRAKNLCYAEEDVLGFAVAA